MRGNLAPIGAAIPAMRNRFPALPAMDHVRNLRRARLHDKCIPDIALEQYRP